MGFFQRKPKWGTAPSGRKILNVELWEKISQEAYTAYMQQDDLSVAGVAMLLNRRYAEKGKDPGFHERGIALLFSDFGLPLKTWDLQRLADLRGGGVRGSRGSATFPASRNPSQVQRDQNDYVQTVGAIYGGSVPFDPFGNRP